MIYAIIFAMWVVFSIPFTIYCIVPKLKRDKELDDSDVMFAAVFFIGFIWFFGFVTMCAIRFLL